MEITPNSRHEMTTATGSTEPALPKIEDASDRLVLNLAHKATQIIEAFPDRIPNSRELEEMTRVFGLDLVTLSLVRILSSLSPNRFFQERVDRAYRDFRTSPKADATRYKTPASSRPELCVIESVDPFGIGAKWGGHVESWRSWGRACGFTTEVIQTRKGAGLISNAEAIRKQLAENPHERRVIATVGQGGAEFRLLVEQLLRTASHELHGIQMWINVAGLIRGGSGVRAKSWFDRQADALSWAFMGWPSNVGETLSHRNPRLQAEPELSGLPFVCVSMVGMPSFADAPVGLKNKFKTLAERGPNDGIALFHEAIVRPGYIVPVAGMSHRAEAERLGPWFQAVLSAFMDDFTRENRRTFDL